MKNSVVYKGERLCEGSRAKQLYDDAKKGAPLGWSKLDSHMRQLDIDFHRLHGLEMPKHQKTKESTPIEVPMKIE